MPAALLHAAPAAPSAVRARRHDLAWFCVVTCVLGWGVAAVLMVARPQVEAWAGSSTWNPVVVLGAASPTLAAIVLTGVRAGAAGLGDLARRVCRWRVPWRWYALVLLGWPAMDCLARLLQRVVTGEPVSLVPVATSPPCDGLPWAVLPSLLVSTLLLDGGPLGEEVGWRGYVLPRLLARRSPLVAAVGLGLVWGLWQVPAFLVAGAAHDARGVSWLVLGTTLTSVLMTWVSLGTRGSVLVAGVLVHLMTDVTVADRWAFDSILLLVAVPVAVALHRTGVGTTRAAVGRAVPV